MNGDRALVWGENQMRAFDPDTGVAQPPRRVDEKVVYWAVADGDHLLTTERGLDSCVLQPRDPETLASLPEPFATEQFISVATGNGVFVVGTADGQVFQIDPDSLTPVGAAFPETNGVTDRLVLSEDGRRWPSSGWTICSGSTTWPAGPSSATRYRWTTRFR
jgi:hypothetical protein